MDDELKTLLTHLVDKVDAIAATQAQHGEAIAANSEAIEQLRHVTASNHFKVIGRIDQVASMLADHMAEPHGPPVDRKRA